METIGSGLNRSLVFAAVVEHGSFTAAAAELGCSKAHASKQVSAIEQELGVQLLHRTTRRLRLTEAGRVYAEYCAQMRELLEEANRAVSAMRTEVAGAIRMTAPPSFGHVLLPELLGAFHRAYPLTHIEADLSVVNRDLIADGIDVAIRSARVTDEHLVARPLGVLRDVVVASRSFVREHGAVDQPEQLSNLPCIVNGDFRDDSHWSFHRAGRVTTVSVTGPIRVNQFAAIKNFAMTGSGIARVPWYLVRDELAAGTLVQVCVDYELVGSPTYLLYPQRRVQPLRCRVFIDFVRTWFEDPARASLFNPA